MFTEDLLRDSPAVANKDVAFSEIFHIQPVCNIPYSGGGGEREMEGESMVGGCWGLVTGGG